VCAYVAVYSHRLAAPAAKLRQHFDQVRITKHVSLCEEVTNTSVEGKSRAIRASKGDINKPPKRTLVREGGGAAGSVPAAEVERDAATGPKRRPRAPAKESEEAAAPSLAGTGAAAGEAAANLETAAALHAMARTLLLPPTASEHGARGEA
jgi:hypothetical protein